MKSKYTHYHQIKLGVGKICLGKIPTTMMASMMLMEGLDYL